MRRVNSNPLPADGSSVAASAKAGLTAEASATAAPSAGGSAIRSSVQYRSEEQLQLLERRAEHVLHDHETRVRPDDDPLRREGAVARVGRGLVKQGDGGHELSNETERGVDVERKQDLLGIRQHAGQANAGHVVGHDRPASMRLAALDVAHVRETGRAKLCEAGDAFAKQELEGRDGCQVLVQREDFERSVRAVPKMADTESVPERRLQRLNTFPGSMHTDMRGHSLCQRRSLRNCAPTTKTDAGDISGLCRRLRIPSIGGSYDRVAVIGL